MFSKPHQIPTGKPLRVLSAGMLVFLVVAVRVIYPGSDAYSHLSWSSALLTDEGFYIHNARSLVLFGHARTDEFNNALIMPLLHVLQVAVFRVWGVGAMQARSISIGLSLVTLLIFWDALRRAWGLRCAWTGLALLGLDPAFILYNRLALMDTPACLPLCAAFWLWVRAGRGGRGEEGERGRREEKRLVYLLAFFLCGLCLGLAYCVRGLTAIVVLVPLVLLGAPLWQEFRNSRQTTDSERLSDVDASAPSPPLPLFPLLALLAGLALVLLAYALLWYLPNKSEMARVNAYYLNHQLRPDSLRHLWQNAQHAFFGDERGIAPYLFRHTPVTFALALLCLAGGQEKRGTLPVPCYLFPVPFSSLSSLSYLRLWLLLMWGFLAVINYAPDRYYILFYPALCGLAAFALCNLSALWERVGRVWWKRAALGGFGAYHLGEAIGHHGSVASDVCLFAFVGLVAVTLALPPGNVSQWRERAKGKHSGVAVSGVDLEVSVVPSAQSQEPTGRGQSDIMRLLPALLLTLWALVTMGWLGDWLLHIRYTQRDADRWLAAHLSADSVLIGDCAPGLCLNNRFPVVPVIAGLCNDDKPVERFAPHPRYIVILDDGGAGEKYKEPWWRTHYPALVAPARRIYYAPRMVRFPVGVYAVPPGESSP